MVRQSARNKVAVTTVEPVEEKPVAEDALPKAAPKKRSAAKAKAKAVIEAAVEKVEEIIEDIKPTPSKKRKTPATLVTPAEAPKTKRAKKATLVKAEPVHECGSGAEDHDDEEDQKPDSAPSKVKSKAKRAPKQPKAEEMPLAARTAIPTLARRMFIGAHVSGAGGVHNSITNAVHIGANSFALFLKSQRKWENPPLLPEVTTAFLAKATEAKYDQAAHVLPHGSYLVNLAQADETKAAQGYTSFVDDLQRCESLGIRLYNFHPGSTGGETMEAATTRIAEQLNRAHKATKTVITVLENMAGKGNVVGARFEDLRDIIARVEDKSRVGVCLDTCHTFAAGYDLRMPEAFAKTMAHFDEIVGLKYLKALHLNDSKAPFESHRDLHANIGTGFLGLRAFHNVMNFAGFEGLPMVLETPIDHKDENGKSVEDKNVWAKEIKLLESLIGMDAESDDFKAQEAELSARGADERKKLQDQVDKKVVKDAKKAKGGKKGKKQVDTEDEDSE